MPSSLSTYYQTFHRLLQNLHIQHTASGYEEKHTLSFSRQSSPCLRILKAIRWNWTQALCCILAGKSKTPPVQNCFKKTRAITHLPKLEGNTSNNFLRNQAQRCCGQPASSALSSQASFPSNSWRHMSHGHFYMAEAGEQNPHQLLTTT